MSNMMESLFPQNETPDLAALTQSLTDAFPQVGEIAPLTLLGIGFGSVAVKTAGGVVVRVARNAYAQAAHTREARLLPAIRQRLPTAIPDPRWRAESTEGLPYGAIAYPRLSGIPLTPERLTEANTPTLAHELATFLLALHRIPLDEALTLGVVSAERRRLADAEQSGAALVILRAGLTRDEFAAVERWYVGRRADETLTQYPLTLLHGDLWYENILVDDEAAHIVGVVDFEHAGIGDPADDLATLRYLSEGFSQAVMTEYLAMSDPTIPGEQFDQRVRACWEAREFLGVGFAALYDPAELPDAIEKLRRGPILAALG